ncbi:hypothetical protein V6N11_072961 [Hibiscus sabdariffa]|uniref:Uncharacterized protein n=1 Tax=Hibiscus sabdariffa TaxID=183260 RepID=A0ABR2NWY0_9ROSI
MEKRERHDEGKEREHGVQRVVSLFVENIPEAMQWKVFWHSKRHGEVVDVYITILQGSGVEDLVLEANSGVVARPRLWCESSWSLIGNKFDWNVLLQPCQSIGYSDGGHARKGGDAPC